MEEVQRVSSNAVRDALKTISTNKGRNVFEAEDFMDDGSRIKLKITIDPETGSADYDFAGTSPEAYGMLICTLFSTHMLLPCYTS